MYSDNIIVVIVVVWLSYKCTHKVLNKILENKTVLN